MNKQYFFYYYGDEKMIFESNINAAGTYREINNSLLGALYDMHGNRMQVMRVNYSLLRPMSYLQVKEVFPNYKML